jgi:hypothetical protein
MQGSHELFGQKCNPGNAIRDTREFAAHEFTGQPFPAWAAPSWAQRVYSGSTPSRGEPRMRFHHMAIFVSDLQEAIHLWRDVMGFQLVVDT